MLRQAPAKGADYGVYSAKISSKGNKLGYLGVEESGDDTKLHIRELKNGEYAKIATLTDGVVADFAWSPDEKDVAYTDGEQIWVYNLKNDEEYVIVSGGKNIYDLQWSEEDDLIGYDDGKYVYVVELTK